MTALTRFLPRASVLKGALALGLALIASGSAQAGMTIRIEEYTDATFTVTTGKGYTATGFTPGPPTSGILQVFSDGSFFGSGAAAFGGGFTGMTLNSGVNSNLGASTSQLVDNETEVLSSGGGPRYLLVTTVQDGYTLPTGPLAFTIDNSQNRNVSSDLSSSSFKSTLTTTTDAGTLGFITTNNTVGGADVQAGPLTVGHVANTAFTFTQVARLTIAASTGDARITVTGTSTVRAVPEPASFIAMASALPLVGIGAFLRRRKAQA